MDSWRFRWDRNGSLEALFAGDLINGLVSIGRRVRFSCCFLKLRFILRAHGLVLDLRAKAPQWRILNALLVLTMVIKTLFTALQFGVEFSLIWLTTGALWGMVLGSILLKWAVRLEVRMKFWLALLCLISVTVAVNILPDNRHFIMTLRHWYQGRLLHFNQLIQWVSVVWLPLVLIWLIRSAWEFKPKH